MDSISSTEKRGDAALRLARELGWPVLPLWPVDTEGKCLCPAINCGSPGKHPLGRLVPNGHKQATCDADLIQHWWSDSPDANVGVATGNESRLFVLDVDVRNDDGFAALRDLDPGGRGVEGFGDTPRQRTGSGGVQVLFAMPDGIDIRNSAKLGGRSLDIRGSGGFVAVPPSRNDRGVYSWVVSPYTNALKEPPGWLVELAVSRQPKSSDGALTFTFDGDLKTHPGSSEGERNQVLCRLVGAYLVANGPDIDVLPMAIAWADRCTPPLPHAQVQKTVVALIEKHISTTPAESPARNQRLVLTPYSQIEPQSVEWLWENRLPLGKLSIIAGDPSVGKTTLACDIAARVSAGIEFPDGAECKAGNVIFATVEDGPADTLRPRFDLHGANPERILNLDGIKAGDTEDVFLLDRHLPLLREALLAAEDDIRLLVIDPISAVLGDINANSNSQVRQVLSPLARLAEEFNVAVLAIEHLNKTNGAAAKPIYRLQGSIGFVGAARTAWGVVRHPEDPSRRVMQLVKNNLADDSGPTGLAYRIVDGVIEWEAEPVRETLEELMSFEGPTDDGPREEAKAWLLSLFADREPKAAAEVIRQAGKDGISRRTLNRAKADLGIESVQKDRQWHWMPPASVSIGGEAVTPSTFTF